MLESIAGRKYLGSSNSGFNIKQNLRKERRGRSNQSPSETAAGGHPTLRTLHIKGQYGFWESHRGHRGQQGLWKVSRAPQPPGGHRGAAGGLWGGRREGEWLWDARRGEHGLGNAEGGLQAGGWILNTE